MSDSRPPTHSEPEPQAEAPGETSAAPPAGYRYTIRHTMTFAYSLPIALDQMAIRLQPRSDGHQYLVRFELDVDPAPARRTYCTDLHGNMRYWCWFEQPHDRMQLQTQAVVDVHNANPFDFIVVDPGSLKLPAVYAEPIATSSFSYRDLPDPAPGVRAYAEATLSESGPDTLDFLTTLTARIHRDIRYTTRPEGAARAAADTLERGEGSCRDVAVLMMNACRVMNLATRFVSGYAWAAAEGTRRELHAWAEVYLPGAGWKGWDPTTGLAVADEHIAVAASPTADYAAPTFATFTAPPVEQSLDFDIELDRIPLADPLADAPPTTAYRRG